MSAYGRNAYPRRFGGGQRPYADELDALLDALAPAFDVSQDSPIYAEVYAHAIAVGFIWAMNGRLKGILIPERMLETLTVWEEAMRLRPSARDNVIQRRKRVAARLIGLIGNTPSDIDAAVRKVAGKNFEAILTVPSASHVSYWGGVSPGVPGFEWMSNRCYFLVRISRDGLSDNAIQTFIGEIVQALDGIIPAWVSFAVGVEDGGYVAGYSIPGITLV